MFQEMKLGQLLLNEHSSLQEAMSAVEVRFCFSFDAVLVPSRVLFGP
jgi:hypothetical protein